MGAGVRPVVVDETHEPATVLAARPIGITDEEELTRVTAGPAGTSVRPVVLANSQST